VGSDSRAVAEVAKTFGNLRYQAETLGQFRYRCTQKTQLPAAAFVRLIVEIVMSIRLAFCVLVTVLVLQNLAPADEHKHHKHIEFGIQSTASGNWSNPKTWTPPRVPKTGDRVLISRGTKVTYDAKNKEVIRLLQIVGTLTFARDRDTELNVAVLKVQNSLECSESGFACDFEGVTGAGEPLKARDGITPTLEIGTLANPIPAQHTARIRLHYIEGMEKKDAPALVCCSARMELHGAPLSRTWVKLGANVAAGDSMVKLSEPVTGWKVGDEVIVTGSLRGGGGGSYRGSDKLTTEERRITKIEGDQVKLDQPLKYEHFGAGEYRSEIANLSRNVIIESADAKGVRGHTLYHAFSQGDISYARFAHLGKEGVLGRYSIHFHLVGDTMRGSQIKGAAIVDSHNRWVTIHGTEYLVVRDCVGYQSVGHGFFMEDGTEVYNVLDRNLGVQAYHGKRLPKQVLPFDPNDGAAFWWANGRNTISNNVACENDEYGFRYDMQHSRYFSSTLPIRTADGKTEEIDVRTIPIWRFENNESHTEGLYGLVVAANGGRQPDSSIRSEKFLNHIKNIDWTGPDTKHPHIIRNMNIWNVHYGFRPHSPAMLMDNVRIHNAAYGIYRPALGNHEYIDLHISHVGAEPFNRGMDDTSAQIGSISIDGLTFETGYGNRRTPLIQISDNNLNGTAATHIRRLTVNRPDQFKDRWPLINRGGGPRVKPMTNGVPIFLHDYFGKGRHAKVVSTAAEDLMKDGSQYREQATLTGDESRVAEVPKVTWPKLLDPVDDVPPATIITSVSTSRDKLVITGVSHDNSKITKITVNNKTVQVTSERGGVVDWKIQLPSSTPALTAFATDAAGNVEQTPHKLQLKSEKVAAAKNILRN
jgi:hypothetical protein